MVQYVLRAWVQFPASYYSSQSVVSNEELLFKKHEKINNLLQGKMLPQVTTVLMHLFAFISPYIVTHSMD